MDYVAELLIGAAPLLGGIVLGILGMKFIKPPDGRAPIKDDLDLLDRLPADQAERRAELQRSVDLRVDDLVAAVHRDRAMRAAEVAFRGSWRDVVLFVAAALFTHIWWAADHSRPDWAPTFAALMVLTVLALGYASRGAVRATAAFLRAQRESNIAAQLPRQ